MGNRAKLPIEVYHFQAVAYEGKFCCAGATYQALFRESGHRSFQDKAVAELEVA
ncbi:MAG: hypothetical protein WD431_00830 [Cyclobacteriaceae bacterium]